MGQTPLRKAIWLLLFPFIEIIRPMRIKKNFLDRWTVLNIATIAVTDFLLWWWCGWVGATARR